MAQPAWSASSAPIPFAPASLPPPPAPPRSTSGRPEAHRAGMSVAPRLGWEALLLLAVILTMVLGSTMSHVKYFSGTILWGDVSVLGLLAIALSLSLRTATPNLAAGGIFAMSGLIFAELSDSGWGFALSLITVIVVGLGFGLILGVGAGLTRAPAWLVTLGGLAVALMSTAALTAAIGRGGTIMADRGDLLHKTGLIVTAVLVIIASLAGGVLWLIPGLRDKLSANRAPADPVEFRGAKLVGAIVGLGASSTLAALAGGLAAARFGIGGTFDPTYWLLAGLAVAVLGGVSLHGRYGGIAGTVLATVLLSVTQEWLAISGKPTWATSYIPVASAIVIGGLVSWALDAVGRRLGGRQRATSGVLPPGYGMAGGFPSGPAFPGPTPSGAGPAAFAPPAGPVPPGAASPASAPPASGPPAVPPASAPPAGPVPPVSGPPTPAPPVSGPPPPVPPAPFPSGPYAPPTYPQPAYPPPPYAPPMAGPNAAPTGPYAPPAPSPHTPPTPGPYVPQAPYAVPPSVAPGPSNPLAPPAPPSVAPAAPLVPPAPPSAVPPAPPSAVPLAPAPVGPAAASVSPPPAPPAAGESSPATKASAAPVPGSYVSPPPDATPPPASSATISSASAGSAPAGSSAAGFSAPAGPVTPGDTEQAAGSDSTA